MIGQFSDDGFKEICKKAPVYKVDYLQGKAIVRYGRNTINYYVRHADGSWTNYDCRTDYSFSIY